MSDFWMIPVLKSLLLTGFLLVAIPQALCQDWPQFRGPNRDATYVGNPVVEPFPSEGPDLVWDYPVGAGFSGPVIAEGRVIVFHRQGNLEVVEALNALTGDRLWKFSYETEYRDDFGFDNGPRSAPVISGGKVYTFGAQGLLHSLELETGCKIWFVDTHQMFGVKKGFFGAASTPLVLGDRLIANIGGREGAGIVAFEVATGKVLWKSTSDEASYSSPIAAQFDGSTMAVVFTREGLVVLEPEDGAVRYKHRWRARSNASVNAATPIVLDDIVFLSASYGTGSIALRLKNNQTEELWSGEDVIDNHYSSCVLVGNTLFGFNGRQEYGQSFRAADLRSGKVLWVQEGMPAGSVTRVGDRLLLLLETGELVMIAVSDQKFEVLAKAQIFGSETRSYPAIARGLFYARDQDNLICLRLWND